MTDLSRPQALRVGEFAVAANELVIGGVPLSRLAARVGSTPFYAYDRGLISRRVEQLRQALPAGVHIHYAMKANPMPAVVQHLAALVDGLDVASAQELMVALDTGTAPARISFAGPGKSEAEITRAVAAGVTLNVESELELERVIAAGRRLGVAPRVAVRVNPDFELKASGMKMGGGAKQFGVDAERVPAMLSRIGSAGLAFEGFHIFSGSQNLRAEAIIEAQRKTLELAHRLAQHAPSAVRTLNIGGGFGIPYFPADTPLDVARVGEALAEGVSQASSTLPGATLVLELGRYLVGEAGVYICKVIDRKESRGHTFLVTDGGLHHHLAASGNFGQVVRKNYPLAVGNRVGCGPRETVSVVGPLCTPLDLLGDKVELDRAEPGDLIVVFQSGAYGLSASPTAFLSHPKALEVLV